MTADGAGRKRKGTRLSGDSGILAMDPTALAGGAANIFPGLGAGSSS